MPDIMLNRDIKAVETTIFNPSHQAQLNDVLLYPTVHICGCSIAQDTWDSVIICIEFKLWRYHGKANSSVLMFWFWVCMLCGFTRNSEFWQFSVSSEVCFLLIPTYSCVDGCSAFPQKAMFREEKERAKTGQKKEWKSMSKEVRVTLSHPAVSSLVGLPLSGFLGVFFVPLLVHVWFWVWNLSPGMLYQRRWKQERAETRGWERHGGGNVETDRG